MKNSITIIIINILMLLSFKSFAQTSNLSIQGVLRTSEGDAVENGEYDLTFRLYTQATTGNPIWEEIIEEVNVKGGIYSIILGAGDTPLNAAFDQPYFLGVSVEGGVEMIPRARLTSSPYALSLIGDDNVFPNSGNVGIGAASPQNKLTVQRGNGSLGLEAVENANNTATITSKVDGLEFSTEGATNAYYFAGEVTEVMRIKKNGKVGIGTTDPQNTLHIVGNNEQVKIEGTDNANMVFTKTSGSATLGFDATNGDDLQLSNPIGAMEIEGNNITLNSASGIATIEGNTVVNGATTMTNDGETLKLVGANSSHISLFPEGESAGRKAYIGFLPSSTDLKIKNESASDAAIQIESHVNITGSRKITFTNYYRYTSEGSSENDGTGSQNIGLTTDYIKAKRFYAHSDRRIKKDFKISEGLQDLKTLTKLEVTDYKHIDEVKLGSDFRKGLIAQQVLKVFPEAITKTPGEIPNIYAFPESIQFNQGKATFHLSKPHELSVGDEVKMIFKEEDKYYTVTALNGANSFSVENWEGSQNEKEVFVFGKKIDDFHSVDYDRVFTLNISATQELARKVEALEKEKSIAAKNNQALKAEVKLMNDRLKSLESIFNATGSN